MEHLKVKQKRKLENFSVIRCCPKHQILTIDIFRDERFVEFEGLSGRVELTGLLKKVLY